MSGTEEPAEIRMGIGVDEVLPVVHLVVLNPDGSSPSPPCSTYKLKAPKMTPQTGRKAWEAEQRRPDPAEVLSARRAVSNLAATYGTDKQIQAAQVELAAAWAAEDATVREANQTARALIVNYGERLRTPQDAAAYQARLDALTPTLRRLVEYADRVRENRRLVGVWVEALRAGRLGDGGEVPAVLDDPARFPHANLLFGRLTAARNAATVQALRDAEATPVDDTAWIAAQQAAQDEEAAA